MPTGNLRLVNTTAHQRQPVVLNLTTFHLFKELPTELQCLVWSHALHAEGLITSRAAIYNYGNIICRNGTKKGTGTQLYFVKDVYRMTRLMHYTGWIKAFETVVIPENAVFFSRVLEATNKKQALKRLRERVDRVVWNVQRDEWEAEWWDGGEKLLTGMSGYSGE